MYLLDYTRILMTLLIIGFVWSSHRWQKAMAEESRRTRENSERLADKILKEIRRK